MFPASRLASCASLLLSALLVACSSAPPSEPLALPEVPNSFRQGGSPADAPTAMPVAQPWWFVFSDPLLNELEARAQRNNTSLQIAAARLQQARALARLTDSQRAPRLSAGAGAVRQGGPLINAAGAEGNLFTASLGSSYEIDLFNRLGHASDAARLDVESREALLRGANLMVQAEVAQTYLALRSADTELAFSANGAEAARQSIQIAERQLQAGSISALVLERLRTELATTDLEILDLERRRDSLEHALAVLIGETASSYRLAPQNLGAVLPIIPAGVPAAVLGRRPDLAASLKAMLAADARVTVSERSGLPSASVNAGIGQASSEADQLFQVINRTWTLGALLSLPLFDGGQRTANMGAASAELSIARAEYKAQFLGAFKDVEDQLSALRVLASHAKQHSQAVASASRSVKLTESRFRNGLASQLDVLESQRIEVRNQRREIQVRSAQFQATVALVKALGGGWDSGAAPVASRPTQSQ